MTAPMAPNFDERPPAVTDDLAEEARRASVRTMWLVACGLLGLAVAVGVLGWFVVDGRDASIDSARATEISLANNERNTCVTERRNLQADALGRLTIAANNAEAAYLLHDDPIEGSRQVTLYDRAVADWHTATESLSEDVLNTPRPSGCGAPITSLEDLNHQEDT